MSDEIKLWVCDHCGETHPRTTEFDWEEDPPLPNHHSVWRASVASPDPQQSDGTTDG